MGYEDSKERVQLDLPPSPPTEHSPTAMFVVLSIPRCNFVITCQRMVRKETGSAGVMSSLDAELGFKEMVSPDSCLLVMHGASYLS
eukprot:3833186-Amphidinium_carterae.1